MFSCFNKKKITTQYPTNLNKVNSVFCAPKKSQYSLVLKYALGWNLDCMGKECRQERKRKSRILVEEGFQYMWNGKGNASTVEWTWRLQNCDSVFSPRGSFTGSQQMINQMKNMEAFFWKEVCVTLYKMDLKMRHLRKTFFLNFIH